MCFAILARHSIEFTKLHFIIIPLAFRETSKAGYGSVCVFTRLYFFFFLEHSWTIFPSLPFSKVGQLGSGQIECRQK